MASSSCLSLSQYGDLSVVAIFRGLFSGPRIKEYSKTRGRSCSSLGAWAKDLDVFYHSEFHIHPNSAGRDIEPISLWEEYVGK